jgi:hypothetical protein
MATSEITGATKSELQEMEIEHQESPLYNNHGVPFEVAFCLTAIGKQPDEYDGPQRYCRRRAVKRDEEEYEGGEYDEAAYAPSCPFHGGDNVKGGKNAKHLLENPKTAAIKHGAYADDEHLKMDFNDEEQDLYDFIMEQWPEIYDWPARSEDPARYRLLRRVAVNEVRAMREEDYLDGAEVVAVEDRDEQGVVMGTHDEENPLAREYRLLMNEVTNQMKELGLTPKERQKMDTLESQADKDSALTKVASDALDSDEGEYDPDQFDE